MRGVAAPGSPPVSGGTGGTRASPRRVSPVSSSLDAEERVQGDALVRLGFGEEGDPPPPLLPSSTLPVLRARLDAEPSSAAALHAGGGLRERGAGVHLSTPETEKYSQDGEGGRVRYGLASMQGWRTTMEDAAGGGLPERGAGVHLRTPKTEKYSQDGEGGRVRYGLASSRSAARTLREQNTASEVVGTSDSVQATTEINDEARTEQQPVAHTRSEFAAMMQSALTKIQEAAAADTPGEAAFAEMGQAMTGLMDLSYKKVEPPKLPRDDADPLHGGVMDDPVILASGYGPHSDFEGPTCGSTACVAIIRNDQLVAANAGDSRCVISRKGQAHDLSRDHKPDLAAEKERINNAGGFVVAGLVNGSLNLTRAIGDMELKTNERLPADRQIVSTEPEVNTVQLCDDDEFMVLACDGIWDCMSSQEVVDFVHEKLRTEDSLSAVCEKMLDRCLAPEAGGDGCDNMTVIVVQFKKPTKSAATTSSAEQSAATTEELRPSEPDDPTSSSK